MDFSISGLASNFDWKAFIDQIMAVQKAPIDKLNVEKVTNTNRNAALGDLATKLTSLTTASTALDDTTLFTSRKAASSTANSTWAPSAAAGTATGTYQIAVTQLATTAKRQGTADVGRALSTTDDVSGLTIATLPTALAVTAGTFSVNGQKVTIAATDSLDQVFTAISTATSGAVTASYDHLTDKITLSGGSEVVLGAANDTSNFLNAMRLVNNGTAAVESSGPLGSLATSATLANARFNSALTAVDGSGNGTFSVNGVAVAYNINTDSLDTIIGRINASGAGVVASFDGVADRMVLTNAITGDSGIAVSEAAGGLMDALGLSGGSAMVRGKNAQFTINGGSTLISASNTLDGSAHGINGLSVTVDSETTQTISVTSDTAKMRTAVESFISKFNDVQSYIADQSKVSKTIDGKVTTSLLSTNREVQSWSDSLRSIAFASVPGLSGTISRLENLGIDFKTGTSELQVKDGAKLDAALRNKGADVAEFFQTATTGLDAKLQAFLTKVSAQNTVQQDQFRKNNTNIDEQIANIQRRLDQQKALLTASFVAMENAQSKIKAQGDALTRAFPASTSSK